jgi:riboflavin kinase/FMN adenylyltransferase
VDGKKHKIEAHIFELDQNLYGELITVQVISRIRDEQKFESIEALKSQLDLDARSAMSELATI